MKVAHYIIPAIVTKGVSWSRVNNIKRYLTQLSETIVASSLVQGSLDQLRRDEGGDFDMENIPAGFGFYRRYTRYLRENKPDVVHLHGLWTIDAGLTVLIAHRHHIPFLVGCYGLVLPGASGLPRWLEKLIFATVWVQMFRNADTVFVTFDEEKDVLVQAGIKPNKIIVLHGYLDPEHIEVKTDYERQHCIVGIVDFDAPEDVDLVCKCLTSATEGDNANRIVFIGSGSEQQAKETQDKLRRINPLMTIHVIPASSPAVEEYFRQADVAVCLTIGERVNRLIATAMATATPVIGMKRTMHGLIEAAKCGYVCEKKAASVYQTLVKMIHTAPHERQQMGKAGRKLMDDDCSGEASAHVLFDGYCRAILH